ncbi:hypothetical protein CBE01nite_09040 [Clostridium beijerinckii]|uniref:WYL domain-containing protein n=1 Tax=Clostridium beijerinckii TaxID=1520 RepID=A0AB74VHY9_CLOBE|nr:WYL domain-containing protein [Clostridium beijerinckii]NRZ25370.1 putative DNA-binding transcriptional regulator YafY [Clostridium beijerinckii]NYB97886.1 putative DNA-binding transcriptional regulator YafY [Clostridium beijerinckii]OOM25868.1 hypothetical protein CLBEI_13850 [Clostridium beijerinckii]QUN36138.1 WYL domain-containing protein [Clostridium beijerinckii]SQB13163.1 Uncharacterised protein [Clostridium beijerinckii]
MSKDNIDSNFKGNRFNLLLIVIALKDHSTSERPISAGEIANYIYNDCKKIIDRGSVDRILDEVCAECLIDDESNEVRYGAAKYLGFSVHRCYKKYERYKEVLSYEDFPNGVNKYYYIENILNPSEIKMLADAIEIYSYITVKETEKIINKLNKLQAKKYSINYLDYRGTAVKRESLNAKNAINIFEAISKFRSIIEKKEKAEIIYGTYNEKKELVQRKGYPQVISPYHLMWSNGYYYLIAKSSKHEELVNYRVDRFIDVKEIPGSKIELLKDDEHKFTNTNGSFSSTKYREQHAVMYSGKIEHIILECKNYMVNTLIDSFGGDIKIQEIDGEWIRVSFKSSVDGVVLWATQYCTDCRAIEPPILVSKVKERLKKGLENYID